MEPTSVGDREPRMLNTRGLSSHRTGVESLLSHPKGSMHNRKGGGKNEYQGNMDNNFIDFVKGKVKMGNTDSTVDWYAVSRVLSTILHIFGAILVLYYWGNAAGDARKAPLLKTNAFFTTDYSSMMDTIANTGMVPLPSTGSMSMAYTIAAHAEPGMKALTQLDKSGMLSRAQPVMIRSRTGNSSAFVPDRCTVIALVDKDGVAIPGTTNTSALDYRDYASWRACRSSNAPMLMMDMAYPYTTMTFFGTNNMLGLIYNTLLITSAISIAMLPVPRGMFNLWVIVAELVLMGNFIGMMAIPFTNTAMHLPPNNAILISVFHLITMVVILALARPRDEERSLNDVKGEDNKWKLVLRYLGTHLVRGGRYGNMGAHVNVYQRPSTGQVMYVEKGGGESIPGGADIPTGVVVEGGDKGDSKVVASIVNTSKGSIAALNPKGVLEDDFAEFLVNRMSMITVRYFEYSMTAGLFLVSVMLVIYPTANVHLYHIVFQGMMMCNLVAIPLSKGIVGACKVFDKVKDGEAASEIMQMYSRWLPFGMAMILLSSFFFFFSSFAPLYDTTKTLVMSSNSGVPSAVYWSIVLVMIMFMLFAVVGGAFITIMIWILPKAPGGTEGHASSMARTMKNQLIAFELLNWFKWFIAGFVCIGALSQIGL